MKLPALAAGLAFFVALTAASKVQRGLLESLQDGNTKDIVISFDGTANTLSSTFFPADISKERRAQTVMHVLEDKATNTQYTTLELLNTFENIEVTSFWISNTLYVKQATADVVEALSKHNGASHIREATFIRLDEPIESKETPPTVMGNEWGVAKIQAPQVWKQGFTGKNVVVASIDTGVRVTHEALKDNYREKNGWFDPYENTSTPFDPQGHGTHTVGTICGKNGIGVAPDAKWFACRGCSTRGCTEDALMRCAQFVVCPHDTKGNNPDCSLSPHIVSNSWGGGGGDPFYKAATDAWTKAGIIPIFANGNDGPYCGTVGSPGDYSNVIAVGSTTSSDIISSFSSKGPAKDTFLVKPDISAPGSDVRSAYKNSDTAYSTLSGTSMATPHVAGVVALLLSSSRSGFTYQEVYRRVTSTANRNVTTKETCGNIGNTFPNNVYGYGRIDAWALINVEPTPITTPPPATTTPQPTTTTPPLPPTITPRPTTAKPAPVKCDFIWTEELPQCFPSQWCKMDWKNLECVPI